MSEQLPPYVRQPGQVDAFDVYRRWYFNVGDGMDEQRSFVVIANERNWHNGRNILRDIITHDEMPRGHTLDRGRWEAQGLANFSGRHLFLYIEHKHGSSCGPIFPIDNEEATYVEEERGELDWYEDKEDRPAYRPIDRSYSEYIEEMQKEGRWQGDRNHPKYPWRKE